MLSPEKKMLVEGTTICFWTLGVIFVGKFQICPSSKTEVDHHKRKHPDDIIAHPRGTDTTACVTSLPLRTCMSIEPTAKISNSFTRNYQEHKHNRDRHNRKYYGDVPTDERIHKKVHYPRESGFKLVLGRWSSGLVWSSSVVHQQTCMCMYIHS